MMNLAAALFVVAGDADAADSLATFACFADPALAAELAGAKRISRRYQYDWALNPPRLMPIVGEALCQQGLGAQIHIYSARTKIAFSIFSNAAWYTAGSKIGLSFFER